MEMTAIIGIGVVAVCIIVLFRQYKPEYALLISLCCSALIFVAILDQLLPALDQIRGMMSGTAIRADSIEILLKSLGLCLITQIASDSCKDAGENAVASRIEFAGKMALVVIALPMFEEVISIAVGFITM